MSRYTIAIKDKETGSIGKIDALKLIEDPELEFQFDNGDSLPYKDFLFFRADYDMWMEDALELTLKPIVKSCFDLGRNEVDTGKLFMTADGIDMIKEWLNDDR